MPVLKRVYVYPQTGFPDQRQSLHGWEEADAFVRSSRCVALLYSEALSKQRLVALRSDLQLMCDTIEPTKSPEIVITVAPEGSGHVRLSSQLLGVTVRGRARVALEVLDSAVRRLLALNASSGVSDGAQALDACRAHVIDNEFEFRWNGPWTLSPDGRYRARARFRLGPEDGWGRVALEVLSAADGSVEKVVTDEAIAYCTVAGFKRSAQTLAWSKGPTVSLIPHVDLVGEASGLLEVVLEAGEDSIRRRDDIAVAAARVVDPLVDSGSIAVRIDERPIEEMRLPATPGSPIKASFTTEHLAGLPVPNGIDAALDEAWRSIAEEPSWASWLLRHPDVAHPKVAPIYRIQVDDRTRRLFRRSGDGGLTAFVPYSELPITEAPTTSNGAISDKDAPALVASFEELLEDFLSRL